MLKNIIVFVFMCMMLPLMVEARAVNCSKHPIFCQITKNTKRIDKKYAMKLSNVIYRAVKKHHIPPRVFVAILAQESSYNLEAKGCHYGFREETPQEIYSRCGAINLSSNNPIMGRCIANARLNPVMVKSKVCSDFGIGQIYYKTANSYGFDVGSLTTDLEYSINAAAQVLAGFKKRYEARENDWWTRYNARSKTKRLIYKRMVERFM
jgi:hypothetical protein